jgi:4-amino-4-deoxy-L-arabinose transferase-like glycosyltransferase
MSVPFSRRVWWVVLIALAIFYLYGLGQFPLVGPDEPRYAEVAREMFLRGDFVTPTLGGFHWFEKPSLLYWLMMAGYQFFGFTEFAARLGPAIAGLVTAWFVYRIPSLGEGHSDKAWGQWNCLAFATSAGALVFSRGASFDIILTATVAGAIYCFFTADVENDITRRRKYLIGFYVCIGLSLLAKGLLGIVLPGGVLFLYFLFQRRWPSRSLWRSLLWGAPLALAVAAIWYGPVIARHRWEFIHDFIIEHHFARYTSNKYLHPQPFWFFIPVILGLALPWTPLLIDALSRLRRLRWRQPADAATRLQVMGLAWLVFPVLFFSLSGSKLPGYVLPALPGAAILIGGRVAAFLERGESRWAMRITGLLLALSAIGGAIYFLPDHMADTEGVVLAFAPLALAGAVVLGLLHRRGWAAAAIPLGLVLSGLFAINYLAGPLMARNSVRDLLREATVAGYASAPIVCLHTVDHSAEFYGPGFDPERLHRDPDGKQTRFEGVAEIANLTRDLNKPVLVIVPMEYADQLTSAKAVQAQVIGQNGKVSLVAVQAAPNGGK